jgi:hypothetical protein
MALRAVLFVGRADDDDPIPLADGTAPVNDPGLRVVRIGTLDDGHRGLRGGTINTRIARSMPLVPGRRRTNCWFFA